MYQKFLYTYLLNLESFIYPYPFILILKVFDFIQMYTKPYFLYHIYNIYPKFLHLYNFLHISNFVTSFNKPLYYVLYFLKTYLNKNHLLENKKLLTHPSYLKTSSQYKLNLYQNNIFLFLPFYY